MVRFVFRSLNPYSRLIAEELKEIEIRAPLSETILSYDVASGSKITSCNKICKPLVVYRFSGNVMTSITTLRT